MVHAYILDLKQYLNKTNIVCIIICAIADLAVRFNDIVNFIIEFILINTIKDYTVKCHF